jgi:hypothetical protein
MSAPCTQSSAQSTPGWAWALVGFRPDTSTVIAELRRRPVDSYTSRNTRDREIRNLALFITDDCYVPLDLMHALRLRRHQVKELCAHWGVDYHGRTLLPNTKD